MVELASARIPRAVTSLRTFRRVSRAPLPRLSRHDPPVTGATQRWSKRENGSDDYRGQEEDLSFGNSRSEATFVQDRADTSTVGSVILWAEFIMILILLQGLTPP